LDAQKESPPKNTDISKEDFINALKPLLDAAIAYQTKVLEEKKPH
jgi:hypothetical protein